MPSSFRYAFIVFAAVAVSTLSAQAPKRDLITSQVDDTQLVTISGDVSSQLRSALDLGPRSRQAPVSGFLLMRRSAENEAAAQGYADQLSDPSSPNYHRWLSNAEIGKLFGPSDNDLARISQWLTSEGLTTRTPAPDGMTIWFEGDVAQVEAAFHTSIHDVVIHGERHYANVTAPHIPAALSPVVSQVVAFSDLAPKRARSRSAGPQGVSPTTGRQYLAPADLATIYNFKPLFAAGITGKGVTIALLEDNDQDSIGDWLIFRKVFGLSRTYPFGTLTAANPQGSMACADPGTAANGGNEEALDVDWATAAAPNATLLSAACPSTGTLQGAVIALKNLLEQSNHPSIVSQSYGAPETTVAENAGAQQFLQQLYQEAMMENVTVFGSGGDGGATALHGNTSAPYGIRVNGYASSPYVTAVGATDTGIQALHDNEADYFSSSNLANFGTALSYIPEIPWNKSCASSLLAAFNGYPTVGPNSFCNSGADGGVNLTTFAGGGGPSGCATGVPSIPNVVSGSCKGNPKPSWQALVGVPNDGVRDMPDVSMFGANAVYGLSFRACDSPSAPCTGDPSTWSGASGTSVASPIWAGIQALVNQATGAAWGTANPYLYNLANKAYGAAGNSACNSSLGNQVASNCVFYDITAGDNAVDCTGSYNCYTDGGTYGVLSTSNTSLQPAFQAGTGYDLASGIGTVNVTNFVNAWVSTFSPTAAPGNTK